MDSGAVIKEILVNNVEIKTIRFFSFSTTTKLQERLGQTTDEESQQISRALTIKTLRHTRFWNALLSIFTEDKKHSDRLLAEAFYHQPNRDYTYVDRSGIDAFLDSCEDSPKALNSKVLMNDGGTRHIPLLDFKVPSKCGHDSLVIGCAKALGLSGYLLDSGKSYHFIGGQPVTESELIDLLAKFVFLDPISDKAWAAHQIIERSASLRISKRNGQVPQLVTRL